MNKTLTLTTMAALATLIFCTFSCQSQNPGTQESDGSEQTSTEQSEPESKLIQYGRMREVIGMQKHHGRIALAEATSQPHLYAVGALEGLTGEVTVLDGAVVATTVDEAHQLQPVDVNPEIQATLLVGNHISAWTDHTVSKAVPSEEFDAYIEQLASEQGIDTSKPFVFTASGDFIDVRLHVIQGACPVHAKLHGVELSENEKPFEGSFPRLTGTLVGVFAKNAAGELTHPDTSTHTHVVFNEPNSDARVTAHVEQTGLDEGAVIRLPVRPSPDDQE
ncbi:hypothetical protein Mal52_12140 [Symmachiella dynata]|uniref:Uncharacterized protein n=1 Tax=Symmachiella dynata TaxID=2527995 RepID=A0A517ZJX9_9PLAN|nr:acetolactate decarboxylase [Symmachiella dynata]QDU42747.1 hypothetical protein Mal52_12140 [Symmachiella dynata]